MKRGINSAEIRLSTDSVIGKMVEEFNRGVERQERQATRAAGGRMRERSRRLVHFGDSNPVLKRAATELTVPGVYLIGTKHDAAEDFLKRLTR